MNEQTPQLEPTLPPQPGRANASALIHDGAGAYLLHLRDEIPGIWEPGSWSLLGGGREPGGALLHRVGLDMTDASQATRTRARQVVDNPAKSIDFR